MDQSTDSLQKVWY